jgi:hypothetical protein
LVDEKEVWHESFAFDAEEHGIIFSSKEQLQVLEQSGTLILMDSTHCTNKYNLYLFTLYLKDKYNTWLPGAQFFVSREISRSIAKCLEVIKKKCQRWAPRYFIIDDSCAENLGVRTCFKDDVKIFLYTVHLARTLMKKVKRYKKVYSLMMEFMFTKTKYLCEKKIKEAIDICQNIKPTAQYLRKNWLECSQQWAMWARQGSLSLLQNRSTNAIESYHRILKRNLKKKDSLVSATKKIFKVNHVYYY